jgi:hypothetical protein
MNNNAHPLPIVRRRRSPNRNNNNRPRLRQGQARRIVALIITLIVLLYLNNYALTMTAADALKVRRLTINSFLKFKNIVQTYFDGYENIIEAGASSIVAVLHRKFQAGTLRPNAANLAVGSVAFYASYRGGRTSNFVNKIYRYNNSYLGRVTGRTAANAEMVRTGIITMIAWLIASLKYFTVENLAGIIREELHVRGLERSTPARLVNYGAATLRLTL